MWTAKSETNVSGMARGANSQRVEGRITRLRAEIVDEGIPILDRDHFPRDLQDCYEAAVAVFLEETAYARHIPVHEGFRPSYGSLLVHDLETSGIDLAYAPGDSPGALALRALCDGYKSVLVRDVHGRCSLAMMDLRDEIELVRATRRFSALAVRRDLLGRITLGNVRLVATNQEFSWSFRLHARTILEHLNIVLQIPTDRLKGWLEVIGELLDFAVHYLSPRGIGSTFVLSLSSPASSLSRGLSKQGVAPPVVLNAYRQTDQYLLANLLSTVDGACLLEPDGSVFRYEAFLASSERADSLIVGEGGTRHNSARRFSYLVPEALVVVVSADGPVTLFSDGLAVARFLESTEGFWDVFDAAAEFVDPAEAHFEVRCEQCGKLLVCGRIGGRAHNDVEGVVCPVCHALLADSRFKGEWRALPRKDIW